MKRNDLFDKFHLFQGHICSAKEKSPVFSESRDHQTSASTSKPLLFIPLLLEHPQAEMQYYVYPGGCELSNLLIDAYEVTNNSPKDLYYPVLPTPCICLYFKFNNSSAYSTLCGVTTSLASLYIPSNFTVFCVRFRPGVADFFTKTPAKKLTDSTFPLNVFLPSASTLHREIQRCESFAQRNLRIQEYLVSLPFSSQYESHALLNRGMDMIHQHCGMLRVSDVAAALACSERYLCRMFHSWVGISTKQYCEMIQMQFSLQEILVKRPKTLAKTAVSYGYFDQPHMNRVYQKFLGRTASDMRFFDNNACHTNNVSAIL